MKLENFPTEHGISHVIFRLAPVYGNLFFLNIHKRVYSPKELFFYRINSGHQRLSLCSINNIIDATIAVLKDGSPVNETYNIKRRQRLLN